ncbi:hypothetical protein PLICRDRAFT_169560 [Plicaturopsis crispa FD-325 SS-3]|nr:hypothetical protein PLICRDRAFT_169560 [Plicaturopsis crispa FD-325 SS-3]
MTSRRDRTRSTRANGETRTDLLVNDSNGYLNSQVSDDVAIAGLYGCGVEDLYTQSTQTGLEEQDEEVTLSKSDGAGIEESTCAGVHCMGCVCRHSVETRERRRPILQSANSKSGQTSSLSETIPARPVKRERVAELSDTNSTLRPMKRERKMGVIDSHPPSPRDLTRSMKPRLKHEDHVHAQEPLQNVGLCSDFLEKYTILASRIDKLEQSSKSFQNQLDARIRAVEEKVLDDVRTPLAERWTWVSHQVGELKEQIAAWRDDLEHPIKLVEEPQLTSAYSPGNGSERSSGIDLDASSELGMGYNQLAFEDDNVQPWQECYTISDDKENAKGTS